MKANIRMDWVFRIALILSLFLGVVGCSPAVGWSGSIGQPEPLTQADLVRPGMMIQMGKFQTMHLVNSAMNGAWWATILSDPTGRYYIITWPIGDKGVAFYVWDSTKVASLKTLEAFRAMAGFNKGQVGDVDEVSSLVSYLQDVKGWVPVTASALNKAVREGIINALTTAARSSTGLTTFIAMPENVVTEFDAYELLQEVMCHPEGLNGPDYCVDPNT